MEERDECGESAVGMGGAMWAGPIWMVWRRNSVVPVLGSEECRCVVVGAAVAGAGAGAGRGPVAGGSQCTCESPAWADMCMASASALPAKPRMMMQVWKWLAGLKLLAGLKTVSRIENSQQDWKQFLNLEFLPPLLFLPLGQRHRGAASAVLSAAPESLFSASVRTQQGCGCE